ncbi:hypothetical protein FRC09_014987 [Ceratobasidium sp. 395]|nr:hypothetical protein FRC09_014987 [Ceratobasidium sp. 395]
MVESTGVGTAKERNTPCNVVARSRVDGPLEERDNDEEYDSAAHVSPSSDEGAGGLDDILAEERGGP